MPSRSSSSSIISPRPRAGGRYNNNRVTCAGLSTYSQTQWGKLTYPGGPKLWRRLVMAFTIMALFGAIFLILGAVFLESAREINEESGISLPVVWCIIGIVCGSLMIACSLVLGKKMISSKWRRGEERGYRQPNSNSSQNNSDSYRETFVPSSRSRSDTNPSSDADLDLPPPYEPNNAMRSTASQPHSTLPPAAVFIISRGDVNLAVPAVIQGSNQESPPKYTGLIEPPTYSESDPFKPPKYEEAYFQAAASCVDGHNEQIELGTIRRSQSQDRLATREVGRLGGGAILHQSEVGLANQELGRLEGGTLLHQSEGGLANQELGRLEGGTLLHQSEGGLANRSLCILGDRDILLQSQPPLTNQNNSEGGLQLSHSETHGNMSTIENREMGGATECQSNNEFTSNIPQNVVVAVREMGGATECQSNDEFTSNLPQNVVVAVRPATPESQSNILEDSSSSLSTTSTSEPEVHFITSHGNRNTGDTPS